MSLERYACHLSLLERASVDIVDKPYTENNTLFVVVLRD